MENIYIKVDEIPRSLAEKYFMGKDLVSIDDLIAEFDNLYYDYCYLKDDYEDLQEDLKENYKPITPEEMYGISDRDFI